MFTLLKEGLIKFIKDPDYAIARLRTVWFLLCQVASVALASNLIEGTSHPKLAVTAQLLSGLSLAMAHGEKNVKPTTT